MKVVASSLTPYIFVSQRNKNQYEHWFFFLFCFYSVQHIMYSTSNTNKVWSLFISPHPPNAQSCSQSSISLRKWERQKGEQTWEWEERHGWKGTVMRQICLWVKKWGQGIPESASLSFSPSSSSSSSSTFSSLSGKGRQQQAHATTQNHDHNNSKCRGGATVLRDTVLMLLCTRNQVEHSQSQQSSWGL